MFFFLQKIMSDSDTESDDSYDSDSFLQNKEKPTPKWDLPRWENLSLTTMTNKSMTVITIIIINRHHHHHDDDLKLKGCPPGGRLGICS